MSAADVLNPLCRFRLEREVGLLSPADRMRAWNVVQNTREFLSNRQNWNPRNWTNGLNTSCLANALRYVEHGSKGREVGKERNLESVGAGEHIVSAIASCHFGMPSIPSLNDRSANYSEDRYMNVLKALDIAIDILTPEHLRGLTTTVSTDVMTDEEKTEINKEAWKAQSEIWKEEHGDVWEDIKDQLSDLASRGWSIISASECEGEDCEEKEEVTV